MKAKFEPVANVGTPTDEVAYLKMPLKLSAMEAMNTFIEEAYGKGAVCAEEPKGWLKVVQPNI